MQTQHRDTERRQLRETENKIFQTGFSHLRKDCLKENRDHPAVLVKQFPQHFLRIFQRDPRTRLDQKSLTVFYWICLERGDGGWRGNHTSQLKPKTYQATQQPIISTPDMHCTSRLSGFDGSLFWKHRVSMAVQISHGIQPFYEDQEFARVMATTREISRFGGGATAQSYVQIRSVRKRNLDYVRRGTWKVAKLEPMIGSCRTPNWAKT